MIGWLDALGINLGTWALLFVIAWYLFRGQRGAKKAGSVLGRAITYTVLILVTGGIAAALDWADLHLDKFAADAGTAAGWLVSKLMDLFGQHLPEVIP